MWESTKRVTLLGGINVEPRTLMAFMLALVSANLSALEVKWTCILHHARHYWRSVTVRVPWVSRLFAMTCINWNPRNQSSATPESTAPTFPQLQSHGSWSWDPVCPTTPNNMWLFVKKRYNIVEGLVQGWKSVCWGVERIPLIQNKIKVSKFSGFKVS